MEQYDERGDEIEGQGDRQNRQIKSVTDGMHKMKTRGCAKQVTAKVHCYTEEELAKYLTPND